MHVHFERPAPPHSLARSISGRLDGRVPLRYPGAHHPSDASVAGRKQALTRRRYRMKRRSSWGRSSRSVWDSLSHELKSRPRRPSSFLFLPRVKRRPPLSRTWAALAKTQLRPLLVQITSSCLAGSQLSVPCTARTTDMTPSCVQI